MRPSQAAPPDALDALDNRPAPRRGRVLPRAAVVCAASALLACSATGARTATRALTPPAPAEPAARDPLLTAARDAASPDARTADDAIAALRALGPAGLAALLRAHPAEVAMLRGDHAAIERAPALVRLAVARVRRAVERVARQRDAYAAGLYWYTDLADARRAARASGRPILSLRMLGHLDDEYSCANSRFFRTALYPDAEVSAYLRDHFVLHWSSERPVPRATIDFGDGRVMERTVTGNSIHYVLDADGRVVEALPGLYGPRPFLRALRAAEPVARESAAAPERAAAVIHDFHESQLALMQSAWQRELGAAGVAPEVAARMAPGLAPPPAVVAPSAINAVPIAVTKSGIELPLVRGALRPSLPAPPVTEEQVETAWRSLAARHRGDARLDGASLSLMRNRAGASLGDGTGAREVLADDAFAARVLAFERSIAEDTLRNEFVLHRTLHAWLAARDASGLRDLRGLNTRVYAELFMTPRADPWLGLLPPDSYPALDHDGLIVPRQARGASAGAGAEEGGGI